MAQSLRSGHKTHRRACLRPVGADKIGKFRKRDTKNNQQMEINFAVRSCLVPQSEFILYQTEDGRTRIQCRFENETMWLTQAQIAELFQTTPQNVTLHLKAIFAEGELNEPATCKDYLQVAGRGAARFPAACGTTGLKPFCSSAIVSAVTVAPSFASGQLAC